MLVALALRNPAACTSTLYSPGARYRTSYLPSAAVAVVRLTPVAVCVIVTEALATTAPLGSVTIPRMPVSSVCAYSPAAMARSGTKRAFMDCQSPPGARVYQLQIENRSASRETHIPGAPFRRRAKKAGGRPSSGDRGTRRDVRPAC